MKLEPWLGIHPSSFILPPSSFVPARIVVVGTSGSGKTTLAAALARRLGVPHVELDALHWGPDWTPVDPPVFRARVAAAVNPPGWVCDGNYSPVRDIVWGRADALVWLDYPMGLVFRRVLWRTLRRSMSREPLWAGNRESLAMSFLSRESILLWVLTTWRHRRQEYPKLLARPEYRHLRVRRFRSPGSAEAWADAVGGVAAVGVQGVGVTSDVRSHA